MKYYSVLLPIFLFIVPIEAHSIPIDKLKINDVHINTTITEMKIKLRINEGDWRKNYLYVANRQYKDYISSEKYKGYGRDRVTYRAAYSGRGKLISFIKDKSFEDIEPNWNAFKKKIFKKYGEPTTTGSQKYAETLYYKYLCWGDCLARDNDSGFGVEVECKKRGKCLKVTYKYGRGNYNISFELSNNLERVEYAEYLDSIKNKIIKREANVLDF